jgi:N-acetylglucosamine repressor
MMANHAGRNAKYVKKVNRMTIINIIKEHEPISRQELAEITGLTPPTVTGIIRELLELGFVQEVGLGISQGGRKPVKLTLKAQAAFVVGVEVTRFEVMLAVADLKNYPILLETAEIDLSNPETGIAGLAQSVRDILHRGGFTGKNLLGAGVAFPGLLRAEEGIVKRSINLGPAWANMPLKDALSSELGMPVYVENNSNCSALAERWFGEGKRFKDLVYINLGEGISAGIIADDRVVRGFQGHAGEIGHIVIDEDGPPCNCGNKGCLEALCGIPALVRRAIREVPDLPDDDPLKQSWLNYGKINIEDIIRCSGESNTYAWNMLRQVGRQVGLAVANVVNLYNPEAVFIGGKLAKAAPVYMEPLQAALYTHAFPEIVKDTTIDVATFDHHSGVIGACALALRELLQSSQSVLLGDRMLE